MDNFPPTYDIPSDHENDHLYTDIPMDPRSVPVVPPPLPPLLTYVTSDDEMEEDPEYESDPEEEEPLHDPISDDDMIEPIPNETSLVNTRVDEDYTPADEDPSEHGHTDDESSDPTTPVPTPPRFTTTSVPEPMTEPYYYASSSRGPRTVRTARKSVRLPNPNFASTSRRSPSPVPTTDPYLPTPLPVNSVPSDIDTFPGYLNPIVPRTLTFPNQVLIDTTDPCISSLRNNACSLSSRISQLEHRLEAAVPGSALVRHVNEMDSHVDLIGAQLCALGRQLAEEIRELRGRENADRSEIYNLRRRLRDLESQRYGGRRF